jgi:CO/xanthine dehydrogenase Mo-binding subunit
MIGYEKFRLEEKPRLQAEGKHVGIGIVNYIEGTGIGPYEGARVTIETNGKVSLVTGVGTQGQGHYTVFAQIVADQLGVDAGEVRVVTGDSRLFHWGTGTFASRGAVVAGNACFAAAQAVRGKTLKLASAVLQVPAADLVLAQGKVSAKNDEKKSITLGELASRANPLRGAVAPGTEPGLEATAYFGPDRGTTANGVHAMKIEVDNATLQIKILDYVVVHDCGKVLNPMILEGQIVGGVAQGIGNAYYEQLVFDDNGQLMNASFMDYLLPQADNVPRIRTAHFETPSPLNPLGVKGAGEAGTIPVGALFAQAIEDAFPEYRLEIREIPLSPKRLFELLEAAQVYLADSPHQQT